MHEVSPYKIINQACQKSKTVLPIYCVKFCQYNEELIFAAAILNKVEIFKINDGGSVVKVRTFEVKKDEYFYALDWTLDHKTDDIMLIGGGMKGKIYNFSKTSIFGVKFRENPNAINEILCSPNIEDLFAVAYEDGSVCLYNLKTETCIAICQSQRANSLKQTISISFDPTGSQLAYGGMTNEIFIVNLKDNEDLQVNLEQSFLFDSKIVPLRLNLLHKTCVIKDLHTNYIDAIKWYSESSLITKSANGDIILWQIKGIDSQNIPFKNNNCLKLVKQLCINIDNCNLWFIRFSLDPLLKYLTIGKCNGELVLWDMQQDSFSKWKCHTFDHKFSQSAIRQSSFSNNGKYLVCCTDDGFLVTYAKSDDTANGRVGKKGSKKTRKS